MLLFAVKWMARPTAKPIALTVTVSVQVAQVPELQQLLYAPVTWDILANHVLLTSTLVGFDHLEAMESASHGSCIAVDAVEIAQD